MCLNVLHHKKIINLLCNLYNAKLFFYPQASSDGAMKTNVINCPLYNKSQNDW